MYNLLSLADSKYICEIYLRIYFFSHISLICLRSVDVSFRTYNTRFLLFIPFSQLYFLYFVRYFILIFHCNLRAERF